MKVHDSCGCGLKPVYKPKGDPFVDASEKYQQMWAEWSQGSGKTAMLNFRRGYEGRAHLIGT